MGDHQSFESHFVNIVCHFARLVLNNYLKLCTLKIGKLHHLMEFKRLAYKWCFLVYSINNYLFCELTGLGNQFLYYI